MNNIFAKFWQIIELICRTVLKFCFLILKNKLTAEKEATIILFTKFGIVGLSNTAISHVFYLTSFIIFQRFKILPHSDYLVVQLIGFF